MSLQVKACIAFGRPALRALAIKAPSDFGSSAAGKQHPPKSPLPKGPKYQYGTSARTEYAPKAQSTIPKIKAPNALGTSDRSACSSKEVI